MDRGAAGLARDPARLPARNGNPAVEGRGELERDEGAAALTDREEAAMLLAALGFENADRDVEPGPAQAREATARDTGVGIATTGDDATDPGSEDRFGAGAGAAHEIAGLEGHGEAGAAQGRRAVAPTRLIHRHDLGVGTPGRPGRSNAEDPLPAKHDGADAGIRVGRAVAARGRAERAAHHPLVPIVRRPRPSAHRRTPSGLTVRSTFRSPATRPPAAISAKKIS
jgi:hypothetical protein